ncbi:outer membrane protein assembly factor BamE [Marinobacter sp.]|jgi:outer membrane protein assembly factor BamE|uniref:outer membrane protein assembly factor BamE n=1 Tax=Marinobacter sp. TaxID=50741 RepID=UPI0019ABB42A|nr:outer membrane protein assembly factor BamE [Marinobacter sp.]MBC7193350.1 outer membrane protein assembly factor BamE [Marinobacter sp.]
MSKFSAPTAALSLLLTLAGCAFPGVYKINVQQGNIVTREDLASLSEGLTRSQVRSVLGTPMVTNPVDDEKDYYIYTFQKQGGEIREQKVVIYYADGQFTHYQADMLEKTPAY